MRLDQYLVAKLAIPSREKAKELISSQAVSLNQQIINKSGIKIKEEDEVKIISTEKLKYVSNGGFKLEKAIREFGLDFSNCTVLDVGASTGGFTDCALQHGADQITAIDVGENQLHDKLKRDQRVLSLENMNINNFHSKKEFDFIVMDVSFISQTHILPHLTKLMNNKTKLISLIKPQFEMEVRVKFKNGIITDEKLQKKLVERVLLTASELNLNCKGLTEAPLQKGKNREWLAWFELNSSF